MSLPCTSLRERRCLIMASKPVFTILCASQIVIGFFTFIFGMIDRIGIQMQISFLMLPIWNGMLFGFAGFAGLVIGRQHMRQGCISSGATSGLKAINMLCFGLSLLTFYLYGSVVMYSGFRIEYNMDANYFYPTPAHPLPKQLSTLGGTSDDDTRLGIFAMIIIFSLVEMFLGAWIVMLEKEKMVMGSQSSSGQRVPLIVSQPNQYIQPAQSAQPSTGIVTGFPQVQQQQQPVYMVAGGGNVPMPVRAVVAPIQQQQQPQSNFVVLQPSAVNQPQVVQQPRQYVVMQNQVSSAPLGAQGTNREDPTDIPTLPVQQHVPADTIAKESTEPV